MNNTKENKEWTYKQDSSGCDVFKPDGSLYACGLHKSVATEICEKQNHLAAIEQAASNAGVEKTIEDGLFFVDYNGTKLGVIPVSLCRQAISLAVVHQKREVEYWKVLRDSDMNQYRNLKKQLGEKQKELDKVYRLCTQTAKKVRDAEAEGNEFFIWAAENEWMKVNGGGWIKVLDPAGDERPELTYDELKNIFRDWKEKQAT